MVKKDALLNMAITNVLLRFAVNYAKLKSVYLKLTSAFIHEAINGGLGIIINFEYRPASIVFSKSADNLLKQIISPDIGQP